MAENVQMSPDVASLCAPSTVARVLRTFVKVLEWAVVGHEDVEPIAYVKIVFVYVKSRSTKAL